MINVIHNVYIIPACACVHAIHLHVRSFWMLWNAWSFHDLRWRYRNDTPNDTSVSVLPDVPLFRTSAFAVTASACLSVVPVLVVVLVEVVLLPLLLLLLLLLLPLLLLLLLAAAGAGGSGGGGGAAAGGGNVLVQAEVGRNHADVEFAIWGGVCNMKRPACK